MKYDKAGTPYPEATRITELSKGTGKPLTKIEKKMLAEIAARFEKEKKYETENEI